MPLVVGGGWPMEDDGAVYRPFFDELTSRAEAAGKQQ